MLTAGLSRRRSSRSMKRAATVDRTRRGGGPSMPDTLGTVGGLEAYCPPRREQPANCPSPEVLGQPSARGLKRAQVVLYRVPVVVWDRPRLPPLCADTYGFSGKEPLPAHRRRLRRSRTMEHATAASGV